MVREEERSPARWSPELEEEWTQLSDEILAEVKAWRAQHPQATLYEIEAEVDARLGVARSRLLEATALAGPVADPAAAGERPVCPECGAAMRLEGTRTRRLTTTHNRAVTLARRYARCPRCGTGLFPPG